MLTSPDSQQVSISFYHLIMQQTLQFAGVEVKWTDKPKQKDDL